MAASRDDIFKSALALEEADRVELISALIDSLDSETEEWVEEAWRQEIERRARDLESGAVQSIPWDVVRERLARAPRG
jgi:putative addiction module component (TIGR02574 family)